MLNPRNKKQSTQMVSAEQNGGLDWGAMRNIGLQVLTGRWFVFFASLLILAMAGATYMFGIYSEDVKSALGYDQTSLNLLSFYKDLGSNVGVLSGLINEIAPPWVVLSLGVVLNVFGYTMMWVAVTGRIAKPPFWQMCLYMYIGANSQTFANTGALVTCVLNFPESRGLVIGLLKGFVGLSGAIIAQLYHALYGENSKAMILFIGWLPAVVSLIFLRTVRIMKVVRQPNELKIFHKLLFLSLGLAGFLMIMIISQKLLIFSRAEYVVSSCIVLILLFAPLALIVKEDLNLWKSAKKALIDASVLKVTTTNPPSVESSSGPIAQAPRKPDSCFGNIFRPPERGEDYTILQALFSIDMLILFTATIFGVGGTLTAIDNLGQIGKSLKYPAKSIGTFVSLVSIWNFLGRVSAGFVSEILLTKYKCPRPLVLATVHLIACVSHLLIAFGVPNSLYIASIIMGLCFGAQWPLIYAIISEIFGLKYYSTLYNFGAAASPVGAYVLNVRLAGYLYDKEAKKQMAANGFIRKDGQKLTCVGVDCYKLSFLIITAVTFLGCITSLILVVRTRKFYRSDIYKKFRDQAEEQVGGECNITNPPLLPPSMAPPPPPPAKVAADSVS